MYNPSPWTVPIFYVPGLIYAGIVHARNILYAKQCLHQHRLPAPVISIGNLTLGGSGKSPLTVHIARLLAGLQANPAILSRGYGRSTERIARIVAPEEIVSSPAATLGDEPALMRRQMPRAWMGISADRYSAGKQIVLRCPQSVFVLDDGFQHRSLHRDLDIVVIDSTQPFQSNRLFPRGSLREPLSELRRCNVAIINGPAHSTNRESIAALTRAINPSLRLFSCSQSIQSVVPLQFWKDSPFLPNSEVASEKVFLVAALGNPQRFRSDVKAMGLDVKGTRCFRDHYCPKTSDWNRCIKDARDSGAKAILITEKDAIKMAHVPDFPIFVCVQSTQITEAQEFEILLRNLIKGWKWTS
jgi:tetraacyldisaccharide 4'-kinase